MRERSQNRSLDKRLNLIRIVGKNRRNTNLYVPLFVIILFAGTLHLSLVMSSLTNSITIGSIGQISNLNVYASSGSAQDIQAAINSVVAAGGIGNVYLPEGVFNFYEVGEPWINVDIPAGVNLFGAPTERTFGLPETSYGMSLNDQVVEWKTVLVMPYDVPGTWGDAPFWFKIYGSGDSRTSRFSDIKLVGYRSFNSSSITSSSGIRITDVYEFRVDHSYFEHITGKAIAIEGLNIKGVIDHSYFVNPVGIVGTILDDCTVFYGVQVNRADGDHWEDDISKVLGQYTDYTTFIEDSFFENWRHDIASNDGAHYIIRYSTIANDWGYGSIDAHGWGVWDGEQITQVGTRAVEIYANQIINATNHIRGTMIRGGGGVAFNNTFGGGTYDRFIFFGNDADPNVSKCWINDWYIWDNTMLPGSTLVVEYDPGNTIALGENYWLSPPTASTPLTSYTPFQYPHPLTLKATP